MGEAFEELRREVLRIVARIDECARIIFGVRQRLHRNRIALLAEEKVGPMRFGNRVQINIGALRDILDRLREAGEGDERRSIGDLRGLVQEDAHIFEAEDFFDALLVVEAADPDPRAIRQFEESVLAMFLQFDARKAEAHHVGQRVEQDRGARRIGVEAQDGVARLGRFERARDDGADDQKCFARPCAAGKAGVALRPFEEATRALLPRAERHHAISSANGAWRGQ
jgi:hypothetical protein